MEEVNDHWTEFRNRIMKKIPDSVGIDNYVEVVSEWMMEKVPRVLNQIGMRFKMLIFNLKSGTLSDDIIVKN